MKSQAGPMSTTSSDDSKDANDSGTNLIINFLPLEFKESQLRKLFLDTGPIASVRIMKNRKTAKSKGYGFVKFVSHEHAQQAIDKYNGLEILGKNIKVAFSRPGGSRTDCNLFVSNLPKKWRDDDLTLHFQEHGALLECRVLRNSNGESRRCGFVRFDASADALRAIKKMDGFFPIGARSAINVKLAERPSHEKKRYEKEKESWMSGPIESPYCSTPPPRQSPVTYGSPYGRVPINEYDQSYMAAKHKPRVQNRLPGPSGHSGPQRTPPSIHVLQAPLSPPPGSVNCNTFPQTSEYVLLDSSYATIYPHMYVSPHAATVPVSPVGMSNSISYVYSTNPTVNPLHPDYTTTSAGYASMMSSPKQQISTNPLQGAYFSDLDKIVLNSTDTLPNGYSCPSPPLGMPNNGIPRTPPPSTPTNGNTLWSSQSQPQLSKDTIFISNIPQIFDESQINGVCSPYGAVKAVTMQRDNTGASLGMAFVSYSNANDVRQAVDSLNGTTLYDRKIYVRPT